MRIVLSALLLAFAMDAAGLAQAQRSPLAPFIKVDAPLVVLEHVRVIDGTGAAPQENMRVTLSGGKITAVGRPRARRCEAAGPHRQDRHPRPRGHA
jgi:hypothetical protein